MSGLGAARTVADLGFLTKSASLSISVLDSHEGWLIRFTVVTRHAPLPVGHDGKAQTGIRIRRRRISHLEGISQELNNRARRGLARSRRHFLRRAKSVGKGTARTRPQAYSPGPTKVAAFPGKARGRKIDRKVKSYHRREKIALLVHHEPFSRVDLFSARCRKVSWKQCLFLLFGCKSPDGPKRQVRQFQRPHTIMGPEERTQKDPKGEANQQFGGSWHSEFREAREPIECYHHSRERYRNPPYSHPAAFRVPSAGPP